MNLPEITRQINDLVNPERIADYLATALNAGIERHGKEYEIKGQGGLYVHADTGQISKPAGGKGSGGYGILDAVFYVETGGKWRKNDRVSPQIYSDILHKAADIAGVDIPSNGHGRAAPNPKKQEHKKPALDYNKPTAVYSYTDENGNELFQNCRHETDKYGKPLIEKVFTQRHKDKNGTWNYSTKGIRKVPFHLHNLIQEPEIHDTEGEKDVLTLESLGVPAVSTKALTDEEFQQFAAYCKGKVAFIYEDNDKAGRELAQTRARRYWKAGCREVRIIRFTDMPEKSDVTDFIQAGHDLEDLYERIQATPCFSPLADITVNLFDEPNRTLSTEDFHHTDSGNARRLVNLHGSDIRYCGELDSWVLWNGKAWEKDVKQGIMRKAKATVRHIYKEASLIENYEKRQARVKWGRDSESRKHLQDMIFLAQSEPELDVNLSDMDADPFLLNVKNGVIDLKTGDLLPHDKTRLLTKYVDIAYDKNAPCPVWENALLKYMGSTENDSEKDERALVMMEFLQRAVGYTLTGDTSEKCFFFLHGNSGNNGKSTFINILKLILGSYAKHLKIDALLQKKYDSIPNDIAMLPGARGVVSSEIPKGKRLNESLVKDLTGKDTISARFMRGEWFDFIPVFKLWIFGNDKPVVSPDDAVFNRVNLIPFDVHIPDNEIDKHFDDKLKRELPGILTWAVVGCLKWQESGLMRPDEVVKATNEYRQEMDIVNDFIAEECVLDLHAKVPVKALYESFTAWCERENHYPLRKREFNARVEKRPGIYKERGNYNAMTWHGIGKASE